MKVLFKKEDDVLTISIGRIKQEISLVDVKVNNDDLTIFLIEVAASFLKEDFKYEVEPSNIKEDERVMLIINLVEDFIKTFKHEFDNLNVKYDNEIRNIKTKIN